MGPVITVTCPSRFVRFREGKESISQKGTREVLPPVPVHTTQVFLRIALAEKRLIEKGAKLDRRTLSDFMLLAAIDRAEERLAVEKERKSRKKGL